MVYNSYAVLNILVVLVLFGLCVSYLGNNCSKIIADMLPLILLSIADYMLAVFNGGGRNFVLYMYGLLQFFLMPMTVIVICRADDYKFAKLLLILIVSCFVFTSITTIIGNQLFPGASRILAHAYHENQSDLVQLYNSHNIGGFEFIYAVTISIPLLIYAIKQKELSFLLRIVSVCILLVFLNLIIISEYTTAILAAFVSLFLFILPHNPKIKHFVYLLISAAVGVVVFKEILIPALASLGDMIGSETVGKRVSDIADMLNGQQASSSDGDVDNRIDAYNRSLSGFFSSPLFGIGVDNGGHSYVLKYLCEFGLLGLGGLVFYFKKVFSFSVKSSAPSQLYYYLCFLFFVQLVLAILNPYIAENILFTIVPLFCFIVIHRNRVGLI